MKKIKLLPAVFAFVAALALTSCNSDDDAAPNPAAGAFVTATVNGAALNFNSITTDSDGPLISAQAVSDDIQHLMQFGMDKDIDPDTYATSTQMMDGKFLRYMYQGTQIPAEDGTLVITSNDGHWINGTFHFEGMDTEGTMGHVTNGEFHIYY